MVGGARAPGAPPVPTPMLRMSRDYLLGRYAHIAHAHDCNMSLSLCAGQETPLDVEHHTASGTMLALHGCHKSVY